eukprot:6466001-Amphidinium_carterae.1
METFLPRPPGSKTVIIEGFSDSDWAGDKEDRRSQTSGHVRIDQCPMCGWSSRQATVSLSSGEAEYNAAVSVISMMMYFKELYSFFGFEVKSTLYLDSAAASGMLRREGVNSCTRHVACKLLWVQQLVKQGVLEIRRVSSHDNPADLGTKSH